MPFAILTCRAALVSCHDDVYKHFEQSTRLGARISLAAIEGRAGCVLRADTVVLIWMGGILRGTGRALAFRRLSDAVGIRSIRALAAPIAFVDGALGIASGRRRHRGASRDVDRLHRYDDGTRSAVVAR